MATQRRAPGITLRPAGPALIPATGPARTTDPAGIAAGIGAYGLWGVSTLYWPLLEPAGAVEILAHRVLWSMVLMAAVLTLWRRWPAIRALLRRRRTVAALTLGAAFISVNWGMFIWAVTNSHVVDASLGYYINPLVSVLLAVLVLRERLDPLRWTAVGLAAAGVTWLTVDYGQPPWISLTLAFSFGMYGLVKKLADVGPLESLGIETTALAVPALGYLLVLHAGGTATFGNLGGGHDLLLAGAGLVTAAPLLLFGAAAVRIPLSMVGMLQYLTPTLQLIAGVYLLGETVDGGQLIGFAAVWAALVVLTIAILRDARAPSALVSA